jgi:hypothetical protein
MKVCDSVAFRLRRPRIYFYSSVKVLRAALKYLDIAVDGDQEEARRECGRAHHMLAKHYVKNGVS